ncbi:hypothetical protein ACNKHQ_02295 [Shigella flexneri]
MATAAGYLGWVFGEWGMAKPSRRACVPVRLRACWAPPACGYIRVGGALILGIVVGPAVLWGVTSERGCAWMTHVTCSVFTACAA